MYKRSKKFYRHPSLGHRRGRRHGFLEESGLESSSASPTSPPPPPLWVSTGNQFLAGTVPGMREGPTVHSTPAYHTIIKTVEVKTLRSFTILYDSLRDHK